LNSSGWTTIGHIRLAEDAERDAGERDAELAGGKVGVEVPRDVLGELRTAVPSSMAAVSWLSRTLTMANSAATKKAFSSTMASTMTPARTGRWL
jgi:hypothetical protein